MGVLFYLIGWHSLGVWGLVLVRFSIVDCVLWFLFSATVCEEVIMMRWHAIFFCGSELGQMWDQIGICRAVTAELRLASCNGV